MKRKVIKMYYSDKPILSKKEDFLKRKFEQSRYFYYWTVWAMGNWENITSKYDS